MICKFFKNKKGANGGLPSIDYLLNPQRVKNNTAKILKGDENLTRELIKSLNYKHKTCVGCLSFAEQDISQEQKEIIMREFERTLLSDEMQGRFNILWVEHSDKGRLELNFVIPRIDLESKKALTPYYHLADLKRVDKFVDLINAQFDFINPKDPTREQHIKDINHHAKTFKDHKALDNHLQEQILKGFFKNRAELIHYLENDLKDICEVTRKGKDYLGIKLKGDLKATRYKGFYYAEQSDYTRAISENSERERRNIERLNERQNGEEITKLRNELNELIKFKSAFYRERNTRSNICIPSQNVVNMDYNLQPNNSDNFLNMEPKTTTERMELKRTESKENDNNTIQEHRYNAKRRNTSLSNNTKGLNNDRKDIERITARKRRINAINNSTTRSIEFINKKHREFRERAREPETREPDIQREKQRIDNFIRTIQECREQREYKTRIFRELTTRNTRLRNEFRNLKDGIRDNGRNQRSRNTYKISKRFRERAREIIKKCRLSFEKELKQIKAKINQFTRRM